MKKILLPFLLAVSISSFCQTNYYYVHGEKSYLKNEPDLILVGTLKTVAGREAKTQLQNARAFTLNERKSVPNQYVIELKDRSVANAKKISDSLRRKSHYSFANTMFSYQGTVVGITDQFVVKLAEGIALYDLQQLAQKARATIVSESQFTKNQFIISVGPNAKLNAMELANQFYETGMFEFSEPNFYRVNITQTNDTEYNNQWGLKNTGQYSGTAGNDINIENAWAISTGRPDVVVAVVDVGVQLDHPDLAANLVEGYDPTGNGTHGAPDGNTEYDAHGTACAGIIGAIAGNGTGIAGIAPNCRIMPIKGFINGNPNDTWLVNAINLARTQGADVISNSWGGGPYSQQIANAVYAATSLGRGGLGCVLLFASGNGNTSVGFPANLPGVVAVGALSMCNERKRSDDDQTWITNHCPPIQGITYAVADPQGVSCDGESCWGSNYGAEIGVVAPGVKIATLDLTTGGYDNASNTTLAFNGTSSATPHAAGVAALILSVNRCLTVTEVISILELSSDKIGNYCYQRYDGYPNGTWNNEMGYGRINAFRAVQYAFTSQLHTETNISGTDQGATNSYIWVLSNGACAGLAAASYAVKRHEVSANVTYPSIENASVVVSSNGFAINSPNNSAFWSAAKNVTSTSATLYTYVYEVTGLGGTDLGWIPATPANIRFDYTTINAMALDTYFQNQSPTSTATYNSMTKIEAGTNVTNTVGTGAYIVMPGGNINFHAAGTVILRAGFEVRNGALFSATSDRFFKCTEYPNGRIATTTGKYPIPPINFETTYLPVIEKEDGLTAFPNPFVEKFTVNYAIKNQGIVVLSILNADGVEIARFDSKGILEAGWYQMSIESGNFGPGIYILKLTANDKVSTIKVIKKQ